jgi:sporulation protein YlmC with PRC-barrel domain
MSRKIHAEALVGRQVRDTNGRVIGRIGEIAVERRGKECYVEEYLLGAAALLSRLGISAGALIGIPPRKPLRVPWQQLDLSDPHRLRLRCTLEELKAMNR